MSCSSPVGVIGLGLIGGSVAKAFARKGYAVYGYDRDRLAHAAAVDDGTVANRENAWQPWIDEVEMVFIATPLQTVCDWLAKLAATAHHSMTVVEVSSVKTPLIPALAALPSGLSPLSLHPMAGRERSGYTESTPDLFAGFPCAVVSVPGRLEPTEVVDEILSIWSMKPVYIDAGTHDRIVAAVSHLPYLVSAALLVATAQANGEVADWSRLVGTGFLDTTRVGASNAELFQPIVQANLPQVLPVLDRYLHLLQGWRDQLEQGGSIELLQCQPARIRAQLERREPECD